MYNQEPKLFSVCRDCTSRRGTLFSCHLELAVRICYSSAKSVRRRCEEPLLSIPARSDERKQLENIQWTRGGNHVMQLVSHHSTVSPDVYNEPAASDVKGHQQGHLFPAFLANQQSATSDTAQQDDRIALTIEGWLLDKYALTQSKCTETTYRDIVISLRTYLQEKDLELDS